MSGSPPAQKRILTFLFLTCFLDLLGIGILIPVMPYLVRQFRTDAMSVALLAVSFSVAQFLASPILGAISDRVGRRPVLITCILGSAFGYFLFGWAGSLWLLYVARVIDGITGGNISTAQACLADISRPEDRAKNFGLIGAAFGLGFILGPAIGGLLSKISLQAPAYGAGALALFTATFGFFALPETLPVDKRNAKPMTMGDFNPLRPVFRAWNNPLLRTLLLSLFILNLGFRALQSNFSVYTLTKFGWKPDDNAWVFVSIGVTVAFTQGFLVRRILKPSREALIASIGFALFLIGFVATAATPVAWLLFPAASCIAFGSSFIDPVVTSLLSRRVPADQQGSVLGTREATLSLTSIAGPWLAGILFDAIGPEAPYWNGALLIALAATIAIPELKRDAKKSD
jgi:MFS transporter, DHA1 family, tetracycline resistance protein